MEAAPAPPPSARVAAPRALVAGGRAGLRRIVFNLLLNACEGDGQRAATQVAIRVAHAQGRDRLLEIQVDDDGPGFAPEMLDRDLGEGATSKPQGWGMGLGLVAGLVHASGGFVHRCNWAGGGASVTVELEIDGA